MVSTDQYLSLFTHYYKNSPKLLAMTKLLLKPFIDLQNITEEYCKKLDLSTATGIYLDLIGKILGYSRNLNFQPISTSRTILTDEEYRKLLRSRQFIGRWDGTTAGFENLWVTMGIDYSQVYGVDSGDMAVTYAIMGNTSPLEAEVMSRPGYFPHTAGVNLNIHLIPITLFGFTTYDGESGAEINTGFCDYTNYNTKVGMFLTYDNWKDLTHEV